MTTALPGTWTELDYERAAREYQRRLPLEHYMAGTPQATQREITVASFAVLNTLRADVQYFNELLVQYFFQGQIRQVVPDNMVVIHHARLTPLSSFAVELQPTPAFLVLEYVSPRSDRKDYNDSFQQYERLLKVPYCLIFHPGKLDLKLYQHDGERYRLVQPNENGRLPIPELHLEVAIRDDWVRYWYHGELLEVPGELYQRAVKQAEIIKKQAAQMAALEENLDQKDREIQEKNAEIQQSQQQVHDLKDQLENKERESQEKEKQLAQQNQQLKLAVDLFRQQVESRARLAGRADILGQLAGVEDLGRLSAWMAELG